MNNILRFFNYGIKKVSLIFATKKYNKVKTILTLLLITIATLPSFAQRSRTQQFDEVGILLGADYYNGEICPVQPFYNPQIAFGGCLRHGFNSRLALSFQALRLKFEGKDSDFDNPYQNARNAQFENEVIELSLQMEFNFLPLIQGSKYNFVSPFIAAGPGLAVGAFPHEGLQFVIPFGIGLKISPTRRFTATIEWKYRKTFTDMLDHINDDLYDPQYGVEYTKQRSFLGNTDMYSFLGIGLMFKVGNSGNDKCGAYL